MFHASEKLHKYAKILPGLKLWDISANAIDCVTVHKVFRETDADKFQVFDEIPAPIANRQVRLIAVVRDDYETRECSSVGINFCGLTNKLGEGRLITLESEFQPTKLFQRVAYFDVLTGTSQAPTLYFNAERDQGIRNTVEGHLMADTGVNKSSPDFLRHGIYVHDNGGKIGIPAGKKPDGYPINYVGFYLDYLKYRHPINCVEVPSYKEPNGGRGFVVPEAFFKMIATDIFKSVSDPRPIYNLSQLALQVSPTVKYMSITLTIFFTVL